MTCVRACVCVCVRARARAHAQSLGMSHSVTPWTAARQAPPSLGLSGRERWSGCRFFLQIDGLLYTNADSLPNRFCNKEIEKRTQWGFKVSFP